LNAIEIERGTENRVDTLNPFQPITSRPGPAGDNTLFQAASVVGLAPVRPGDA
jgi:hypothetical protein